MGNGYIYALVEFIVFFTTLAICLLIKIDSKQNKPYMDEVFHVPQAQLFCKGIFNEWDPMITTLPGLYLFSIVTIYPLSWIIDKSVVTICTTFSLRFINIGFATGNAILLFLLLRKLSLPKVEDGYRCLMLTVALSSFPLLYFFTFLYYTDSGSTFWVLLMYYLTSHQRHKAAALSGTVAVLFRQTNIVWVTFMAGITLESHIIAWIKPEKKDISEEGVQEFGFLGTVLIRFFRCLKQGNLSDLQLLIKPCLAEVWPYCAVVGGFLTFVFVNGSIVVGAKDDHKATLHFPQLFYFVTFTCGFSIMYHVTYTKIKDFLYALYNNKIKVVVAGLVCTLLVWRFTMVHKYTLADNRHYPFYVWGRVYGRHPLIKYCLVPAYIYAGWSVLNSLKTKTALWKASYIICVFVNLVPQMLLEFRYFILPYLLFRINSKPGNCLQICLEISIYTAVNAGTLYLFIEKPFNWDSSSDLQRFMW